MLYLVRQMKKNVSVTLHIYILYIYFNNYICRYIGKKVKIRIDNPIYCYNLLKEQWRILVKLENTEEVKRIF